MFENSSLEIITIIDAPSREVLKARLDRVLNNLVQWRMSQPMAGGL